MSNGEQFKPRGTWVRVRDTLLGRPTATGAGSVAAQLVLIAAWYGVGLALPGGIFDRVGAPMQNYWDALGEARGVFYRGGPVSDEDAQYVLGWALAWPALVGLNGVLGYVISRVMLRRRPRDLRLFIRSWWRACLWGIAWIPLIGVVCAMVPFYVGPTPDAVGVALYMLLAPGFLARAEVRPRRRARWQPVCPECGYSLRRLNRDTCPECGEPLPTTARTFRRWANLRLVWDRRRRGALPFDYLKTGLNILLRPWRAARGLTVPDRLPRAARWAAAHVLVLSIGSALLAGYPQLLLDLIGRWRGDVPTDAETTPVPFLLGWAAESMMAWMLAFGLLPALGVVLGMIVPGRHPLAKRGIAKWSLYATPVIVVTCAAFFVVAVAVQLPPTLPRGILSVLTIMTFFRMDSPHGAPLIVPAVVYALWWAAGVAANPYVRVRGVSSIALHAAAYLGTWLLVTEVLFPPGALEYVR